MLVCHLFVFFEFKCHMIDWVCTLIPAEQIDIKQLAKTRGTSQLKRISAWVCIHKMFCRNSTIFRFYLQLRLSYLVYAFILYFRLFILFFLNHFHSYDFIPYCCINNLKLIHFCTIFRIDSIKKVYCTHNSSRPY